MRSTRCCARWLRSGSALRDRGGGRRLGAYHRGTNLSGGSTNLGVPLADVWQSTPVPRGRNAQPCAAGRARRLCVYLDGDCIVRPTSLRMHRCLAERDGSSPATACCCRAVNRRPCCATALRARALDHYRLSRDAGMAALTGCAAFSPAAGPLRKRKRASGRAPARAILRSGAATSMQSTDLTRTSTARGGRLRSPGAAAAAGVRRKDGRFATGVVLSGTRLSTARS